MAPYRVRVGRGAGSWSECRARASVARQDVVGCYTSSGEGQGRSRSPRPRSPGGDPASHPPPRRWWGRLGLLDRGTPVLAPKRWVPLDAVGGRCTGALAPARGARPEPGVIVCRADERTASLTFELVRRRRDREIACFAGAFAMDRMLRSPLRHAADECAVKIRCALQPSGRCESAVALVVPRRGGVGVVAESASWSVEPGADAPRAASRRFTPVASYPAAFRPAALRTFHAAAGVQAGRLGSGSMPPGGDDLLGDDLLGDERVGDELGRVGSGTTDAPPHGAHDVDYLSPCESSPAAGKVRPSLYVGQRQLRFASGGRARDALALCCEHDRSRRRHAHRRERSLTLMPNVCEDTTTLAPLSASTAALR